MRKPIIWATTLAIAAFGAVMVSCDSKGSNPTSSGNDTTGTGGSTQKVSAAFSIVNPATGDTLLTNDVTSLLVKFQTVSKTGVTGKVGGTAATASATGLFTAHVTSVPVGITRYTIVAASADDTAKDSILVTRQLAAPQINPTSGQPGQTDFTDSVTIQFKATDANSDSIHYSTGGATARILGSDPYVASGATKKITGTTTFRAISYRKTSLGTVLSDTTTATFTIGRTLGKPYFSTNRNDSFTVQSKVGIGGYGVGDTVLYTVGNTTGSGDPTRDNGMVYSNKDSILVQTGETIIAKTFNGGNSSPTCTTTVKLNGITPVFSAKSGTYTSPLRLTIKSASSIPVFYTTDGSTPTNQSLKASDSMLVDSNVTIKAMAMLPGWSSSPMSSASYKFKVANPTLSFRTGNYDTTQTLVITDSAPGASIRYTTDGSTPTCGSKLYNPDSALRLDSNVVVQARACRTGWDSSDVATGNYTFKVSKITFSPDSGIYRNYQVVKLSTRSPGVVFYVTRDSSQPAWNGSGAPTGSTMKLTSADTMLITKSQWLRVIAARNGWANSVADSRRYIIEGDTLLVDDFEQNSLTNPIGTNWRFWACGYCVNTGIADQMSTIADSTSPDWNRQIGFRNGHISFHIPVGGARQDADGFDGPGYAGYSVGVPSALMGETYRLVFWARWKPSGATSATSIPFATEMVWKTNDNQNGSYKDGFQRYIDTLGTTWRRFILDYSAFYPAGNAYDYVLETDSTNTTPKSFRLFTFGDSAGMNRMGLSKFQGPVYHALEWTARWKWTTHDAWNKGDITNFRWSIIQPDTNRTELANLGAQRMITEGTHDTLVDSTYKTSGGADTTSKFKAKTPTWVYCGDCHNPHEPEFNNALKSGLLGMDGSIELDRIQLVRRPQVAGGIVIATTPTDTTTKK